MDTITITIDGTEVRTTKSKRILEAALDAGIYIPNLCALRDIKLPFGACRLCEVHIEGRRGTVTACSEPVADSMVVHNNTAEINKLRRKILEILLARHPHACLTCWRRERCQPFDICLRNVAVTERCVTCPKNGRCKLQKAVDFIGLNGMPFSYTSKGFTVERDNPFIVRDNNLCILCGRCVRVDQEILGFEAIAFNLRGAQTYIGGAFGKPLIESGCTFCGSCVEVCPVGALMDRSDEWTRWPDREAASIRCKYACPVNVDVPRFIRFIREEKYAEAVAVIREKVPFASICSLICEHPCEISCRRGDLDQPVAIRALERFTVEHSGKSEPVEGSTTATSGKKVAIIGSGPAGLTTAYYLAKRGRHKVTIFEKLTQAGGIMQTAIPEYVLPRNILDAEIESLKRLGVEIKTKSKVESLDKLFEEDFDAVFLAIGGAPEIPSKFDIMVNDEKLIEADPESLMTGRKGVFAGGDAVTGKLSFIEAVASGREAAISIDHYLGGSGDISETLTPIIERIPRVGRIDNFAQRQRQKMPTAKPAKQIGNFAQIELGFTDELGSEEAKRCMGCDLRFAVASMVADSEYKIAKSVA
ncbi:MAG: FAD-dependent oxidoreductase [Chloroflexi bacterium]|nr:FAD-dependent oxidoreductase [Chloroflexota bacterium]